jgi:spore coat polysaccharide biosynthesis protein SpsF
VAIVQARMGSTRRPGKVLAPLAGRPLLALVLERTRRARGLDEVVVATTELERDDRIVELAEREGVRWARGSETDVLDRYHSAALAHGADVVVRITADCPLVDPALVDRLLELRAAERCDYAAIPTGDPLRLGLRCFPDGLDAEAMTCGALDAAWREATDPADREHVTRYFKLRPERFAIGWLQAERDYGGERWTVDHPADLEFVQAVLDALDGTAFGYADVLAVLDRDPRLRALNRVHAG